MPPLRKSRWTVAALSGCPWHRPCGVFSRAHAAPFMVVGLVCLGLLSAPMRLLAADVTLTASDPFATSSFDSGLNWSDGLAPAPGNAYFTAGFLLRTPEITGDVTFGGGSLSLDAGGTLASKTDGLVTVAELILNGGSIDNFGGPDGISKEAPLAGAITVAAASTFNGGTTTGRAIDVRSTMSGAGGITIGGSSGTYVLYSTVAKDYRGGTTINAGSQLRMGVADALPFGVDRGSVTVGGQLNLNGFGTTVNALAGSGTVTSAIAATLTVGAADTTSSFGGQITGSVAVVKSGTGALTLSSANNTFTGGLTISAGRVVVGNTNALGPVNSQITVASGAALDFNGGITVSTRNYNATIAGTGTDGTGAIFNNGLDRQVGFKTLTLSADAAIGGTGRFDVRPATAGEGRLNLGGFTLTKSGTNVVAIVDSQATQDGSINVTGGVLGLTRTTVSGAGAINVSGGAQLYFENNNSDPLPTISKAINLADGATLRNGGAAAGFTVSSEVSLAGATTWDMSGNPLAMTGIIAGAGGLTKIGSGSLTLSAANTFTGGTTVTAGTLTLSGGANRLSTTGGITVSGGSLNLGGNGQTASGLVTLGGGTVSNGTLTSTAENFVGTAGSVSAVLGGGVGLTKISNGTLTLSAANTFTGGTTVTAGTLALTGGANRLAATGDITVTGGSLNLGGNAQATTGAFAITGGSIGNGTLSKTGGTFATEAGTVSAVLTGTAGLAKTSSGTLALSAANTFSGDTTISGGTLRLDFAAAGAPAADILPAGGAVTLSGGVLDLVGAAGGTTSQSLGGLLLASDETVTVSAASGAAGSADLALGAITRSGQGGVNFVLPASGSITTTTANTGGILGAWATVGG